MKWYVIKIATGKEKKIKELVDFEINERRINANLKIPMENKIVIRNGKKVNTEKAYFPGYLFIECDNIGEIEGVLKHINGVSSILKQPLTDREIDRFLIKKEKEIKTDEIFYQNQNIKIIDGPFSTFVGTIKSVNKKDKSVKVGIMLFGREIEVELKFSQISS